MLDQFDWLRVTKNFLYFRKKSLEIFRAITI